MTARQGGIGIGRRLASARIRRGLSQGTLGRLARLAPCYLSRIETGRIEPSFRMVDRIAAAMRVGLDELANPAGRTGPNSAGCPISQTGQCLLELIRSDARPAALAGAEGYTLREIRVLQHLAQWMRAATPDRLRAVDVLLEDLLRTRRAERNWTAPPPQGQVG